MNYPLVALFSQARFSSTYTRTRNGKRQIVRKSQNRLKVERGRISARVSVPVNKGEVYGLGVGSVRSDRRNIQRRFRPSISDRGIGITAQGNLGRYQIKARGYTGYNPNFSQFNSSDTYTRRTKTGKMAIARKGSRNNLKQLQRNAIIATVGGGVLLGAAALLATRGKAIKSIRSAANKLDNLPKVANIKVDADTYISKAKESLGDVQSKLDNPNHVWEF
ncbi:MAG: hypothetical protein RMY28_009555 [Nostoc sp. ChiSLP01]|nr:hypothetical protein [Nostoc sp. CmiSLP01]MDZ8285199.1 hypothetical protein [Nostoc sp. ChiSLP01]